MAGSKFAYVRNFELPDPILPGVYMVVRIDGKGFHKFSTTHNFHKPNDAAALELMNRSALHVCQELKGQITLAFGESDEYSFLFRKDCKLYNRRGSKILTYVVSLFTSAYLFYWSSYLPQTKLQYPPTFDGRIVLYPTEQHVKDYFSWRQADTHINNLYNTTFWALVLQGGKSEREAHERLKGTLSGEKNEILWGDFGINYAKEWSIFRKGSLVVWTKRVGGDAVATEDTDDKTTPTPPSNKKKQDSEDAFHFVTLHVDLIGNEFWNGEEELTERERKKVDKMRLARNNQESTEDTLDWERPERLEGVGMGRWVL